MLKGRNTETLFHPSLKQRIDLCLKPRGRIEPPKVRTPMPRCKGSAGEEYQCQGKLLHQGEVGKIWWILSACSIPKEPRPLGLLLVGDTHPPKKAGECQASLCCLLQAQICDGKGRASRETPLCRD